MNYKFILSGLLSLGISQAAVANQNFTIDESHTNVNFDVAHLVISTVKGRFDKFDGSFVLDEKDRLVKIEGTVATNSVDTDNKKRDKHLVSEDFFHSTKFPKMTFTSSDGFKIKKGRSGTVKGKLTIRGVTKDVKFKVKYAGVAADPFTGTKKAGFVATTTINRKDFGLNWNETLEAGGVLVGNEVEIEINVQGKLATAAAKPKKTKS